MNQKQKRSQLKVITLESDIILQDLKETKKMGVVLKLDFEKAYDKIQWSFLIEILRKKEFSESWISWIKQVVETGRV